MEKDQIKIAWVIVVLIVLFAGILKYYDYTMAAIVDDKNTNTENCANSESAAEIIKKLQKNREEFSKDQEILLDHLVITYESEVKKLSSEKEELLTKNTILKKEIETINKPAIRRINELNPALEASVKKVLRNRIKYIHDRANPQYPLPERVVGNYVEWTYKWAKKHEIPVLFFAAIPEAEANWVSKDSYDHGNSWTAFSMQIGTIRSVLMSMGYQVPGDREANNNNLNHKRRFRNFTAVYKSKLMDGNLDMKELTFEVAAEHIKWLYQRYDGDLARVAEAYNRGHSPTNEISTNYPMNVLGRYNYLLFQLQREMNRNS